MHFSIENMMYSFIGIFVAMDIIGILPIYMGMTKNLEEKKRRLILKQSVVVAFLVALSFFLMGKWIFKFLGIAMYDFKVGGGIVLMVMAILDLIKGKDADEHSKSTGVVPLAVPLISGPALITTLMLQVGLYGNLVVLISMVLNFCFAYFAFRRSTIITKAIGMEGTDIVSKIAALLMTAIAFSMIRIGIFEAIKMAQ